MPARLLANPAAANSITGLFGLALAGFSESDATRWSGVLLIFWSAVMEAYRRLAALRREEARADLEARLAAMKTEAADLEVRIAGLRGELSGLEIDRNQRFVETGE